MKLEDIPQQPDEIYEGETKILYGVGRDGRLQPGTTTGWEAEISVLKDAIDAIDEQAIEAFQQAEQGICSPLKYHMFKQRMDLPMLSQAMGKFQWQVKRHFKPAIFAKLSKPMLEKYSEVLDMPIDQLTSLPRLIK